MSALLHHQDNKQAASRLLLAAYFLLGLNLDPEDEAAKSLRNVDGTHDVTSWKTVLLRSY
jgi:hypothetical protein